MISACLSLSSLISDLKVKLKAMCFVDSKNTNKQNKKISTKSCRVQEYRPIGGNY